MNLSKAVVLLAAIFALRAMTQLQAQVPEGRPGKSPSQDYSTLSQYPVAAARELSAYRSLKKPGHYTTQDWRALIDSYWGPGPSTATKLQIFDFFWDLIDKQYAGFPNLAVNWDSLKAVYRPEIEAGVSRGRLWGIIGHMYLSLQEIHTWMSDIDLDGYFMDGGNLVYKPGIPAFFPSGWGWAGSFGAALTPLPDSSLLVYKALPVHPLGIVPGDIILGYDGIPWKQLYRELLSAELPIEWWGGTNYGSSPRSMTHGLLASAGSNWGLFDTVDVVRYSTGDTVHLPTAALANLDYLSLYGTEQIAVPGVKMPDYPKGERVTWGIVDGTTIGYIYAYCWDAAVGSVFETAVRELVVTKNVSGLILDFRYNIGSIDSWTAANAGLDYLFNEDPISPSRAQAAARVNPSDHFGFTFSAPPGSFQPRPDYYDRPIAVLTGPYALSLGDHVPFRMRSHPMVRVFGLPTNGAFIAGHGAAIVGPVFGNWYYRCATTQLISLVNNEGFLMHNTPPVDEEVWLMREGAAKGEDDVVKRAVEWISTLTYAHDATVVPPYSAPGLGSVCVRATLTNPLHHAATLNAIVNDGGGALRDSVVLYNDGLHGDGSAGDSVWGAYVSVPSDEGVFNVSILTEDNTQETFRRLPNAALFATAGPLAVDSVVSAKAKQYSYWGVIPYVKNNGTTWPIQGATVKLICEYPWVKSIVPESYSLSTILPGGKVSSGVFKINYDASSVPDTCVVTFELAVNGTVMWAEPKILTGVSMRADRMLPTSFALEQNYPNPFNPVSTVGFSIAESRFVTLKVYDILGREVATLVNEKKAPGNYEVKFSAKGGSASGGDATGLSSGVYFYRLTAGEYVECRKMVLMR